MSDTDFLARWARIAGLPAGAHWTKDNLAGFFQVFRPSGAGLTEAFEGVKRAEEILPRLLDVYRATESGWEPTDVYFRVRKPQGLQRDRARELVGTHLSQMVAIGRQVNNGDLLRLLEPLPRIEIVQGDTLPLPDCAEPEILIHEVRTDFMASLVPVSSPALLLDEALYHLANDCFLRDHILWPLYRHSTTIVEPFAEYFELWKHGSGIRIQGGGVARVFVPVLVE